MGSNRGVISTNTLYAGELLSKVESFFNKNPFPFYKLSPRQGPIIKILNLSGFFSLLFCIQFFCSIVFVSRHNLIGFLQ